MDNYKIYTPWLKGLANYSTNDYKSLDDFCRSVVHSIHNIYDLIQSHDLAFKNECFSDIIQALKENKNLIFCGTGTFASVFLIKGTLNTLKINISSFDSVNDPWIEYVNKIRNDKINNSWFPTISFIFARRGVYGAIGEILKPIKELGKDFDKSLLTSIRACLKAISNQNFKIFKEEKEKIKILLTSHELKDNTDELLYALDLILKIKKEQNAEIDLVGPNVMFSSERTIILNDPLSFGKYSSLK